MVRSEKLVTAILMAAIKVMQLVAEREGKARRLLTDVFDPGDQPALETCLSSLEGKTEKTKEPASQRLACLCGMGLLQAWRLDGYYGKPGSHRHAQGPNPSTPSSMGWSLRDV